MSVVGHTAMGTSAGACGGLERLGAPGTGVVGCFELPAVDAKKQSGPSVGVVHSLTTEASF